MEGQITLNEWMQWKEDIRRKLRETASNFVYIGYRLKQIRDSGMYDGCDSVYEFAEKEYGLSRSIVSRFMAINDKFSKHGNSIELRDEFVGLNQSQLSEMLTLPVSDYEMITEDTAIKDIRELKKFEKDAMNPPEEDPGTEEPENSSTMRVAENPDSGNEPDNGISPAAESVATSQIREFTPLQKCIIDFFRDKLDLLDEVEKAYTIRDAAELLAPNGCTTHRKGIVFLTMQDYDKGIKYKQMGVPLPISMNWDRFFGEIRTVFFDFEENYKERLKEIYPESVQKEPESVPKTEKTVKEPQKTAEEQSKEEAAPAAEETTVPAAEEVQPATEKSQPAAEADEIRRAYHKTFRLIRKIEKNLGEREWGKAYICADVLAMTIDRISAWAQEQVNEALDAELDNEEVEDER